MRQDLVLRLLQGLVDEVFQLVADADGVDGDVWGYLQMYWRETEYALDSGT